MKIAFLYSGQGSQKVGMGLDFYKEKETFKKCFDILTEKQRKIAFEGSMEELSQTINTQPIMVAFAIGVTEILKEKNISADMVAGLSLGEYAALYSAGVFTKETAIDLVSFRAKAMAKASENLDTQMIAVLNLDRESLVECVNRASEFGVVEIANYNYPGQIVIAGESIAVDKAAQFALEKGAKRCVKLNVSGPFHTSFMKSAGDALEEKFKDISFNEMKSRVIFNATGKEKAEETYSQLLVKQVQSSVYFEDSIKYMIDKGIDTFIEIGPSKSLTAFVRKMNKDVKVINIENMESLKALEELCKQ